MLSDWLSGVRGTLTRAHVHINQLCEKSDRWKMSIPVSKGDSDMILQAPLDDLELAVDVIGVLVEALKFECGNRCAEQNPCNARDVLAKIDALLQESRK